MPSFSTDNTPVLPPAGDGPQPAGSNPAAPVRLVLISTKAAVTIGGDVLISGSNNAAIVTLDARGGNIVFGGSFNRTLGP